MHTKNIYIFSHVKYSTQFVYHLPETKDTWSYGHATCDQLLYPVRMHPTYIVSTTAGWCKKNMLIPPQDVDSFNGRCIRSIAEKLLFTCGSFFINETNDSSKFQHWSWFFCFGKATINQNEGMAGRQWDIWMLFGLMWAKLEWKTCGSQNLLTKIRSPYVGVKEGSKREKKQKREIKQKSGKLQAANSLLCAIEKTDIHRSYLLVETHKIVVSRSVQTLLPLESSLAPCSTCI